MNKPESVACSPFPWKCKFGGRDTDDGFTIVDRDGRVVCEWWPAGTTEEERKQIAANAETIMTLSDENALARELIAQVHPRVWKLVEKQRQFIVIGEHEPYYMEAYAMIRDHEMSKGTWTEEDRVAYAAAQLSMRPSPIDQALPYGCCPHCGANVTERERRPNGNDTCENGHVYPSRLSR